MQHDQRHRAAIMKRHDSKTEPEYQWQTLGDYRQTEGDKSTGERVITALEDRTERLKDQILSGMGSANNEQEDQ